MAFNYKTASKKELKDEYNRIAKEMGDDQFFTKKELNFLPEILQDGEEILAFTSGLMGGNTWLITLSDRRIIFLDKGMIYGLKQEIVPLNRVNAISGSTGIIFGKIIITDGAKDREITNVWKKTVKPFTNKCQEAIDVINQPQTQVSPKIEEDPYAKLEKLASLKEKGIISEDEFEKEKKKILG
ncbi:PH domain-containing protein [Thermodesulfovibrionales bacterium]|nr:PH domain-containing protein [Thermodesulfovibrionales bacterium]